MCNNFQNTVKIGRNDWGFLTSKNPGSRIWPQRHSPVPETDTQDPKTHLDDGGLVVQGGLGPLGERKPFLPARAVLTDPRAGGGRSQEPFAAQTARVRNMTIVGKWGKNLPNKETIKLQNNDDYLFENSILNRTFSPPPNLMKGVPTAL